MLSLRPLPQPGPGRLLPLWWGRAAHALLLNTVRQYDPPLAEALHAPSGSPGHPNGLAGLAGTGLRPFTASTLMGRLRGGNLDPHALYTLRLTACHASLAAILLEAARAGPLAPGKQVELDTHPFEVQAVLWEDGSHPWAGAASCAGLSAPFLLASCPAPHRISLQFASPTSFKSGGLHLPVPLPDLVFGSLLERWNAFAPVAFPPEARRYAAECLAISRFKLSSRSVPFKSGALRMGAVGEISFASVNYDRYWMSLMAVLAAFALYAGVGSGASQGLGQCRQVESGGGAGP